MDMVEIMSDVREISRLKTENELATPLLKRFVNRAQDKISQLLLPTYSDWIMRTLSGTGTGAITIPGDVAKIIEAKRATTPCEIVPTEDRDMIGWSVNTPGDATFPAAIQEGSSLIFYPALASTAYTIRYRKRLMPMIEGRAVSASTTTITLPAEAVNTDDAYNDHEITLYTFTSGQKTAPKVYRITDYAGATRLATISGTITHGPTTYYCALWSLIPREYVNLIVDGALWYLARAGKYQNETPQVIMDGIVNSIASGVAAAG